MMRRPGGGMRRHSELAARAYSMRDDEVTGAMGSPKLDECTGRAEWAVECRSSGLLHKLEQDLVSARVFVFGRQTVSMTGAVGSPFDNGE